MYILESIILEIKNIITNTALNLMRSGQFNNSEIPDFEVEIPADNNHGDLSSNFALMSAKVFKIAPRKIAELLVDNLNYDKNYISKVEIAGPGFINFFLSENFFSEVLKQVQVFGNSYGLSDHGKDKKIMVEFVSANPTGPMHMGNARLGALGDCLAEVLKKSGYDVYKEFYVNDAGNQIDKFGLSLDVRYRQICQGELSIEMPENAYHGEDITELSRQFFDIYGDEYINKTDDERKKALIDFALPKNISRMQKDMEKYKIIYDNWFYESKLHSGGEVTNVIKLMTAKNLTYEKDGSLWYKATEFGSEKDEVLVRSNGIPTYFAADIAYHYNKFVTRGFDICIDIWGADHHGHVERMKGAMEALGIDRNRLHVVLVQLVRLIKNGEIVRMSKRTGKAIQLSDLLDEVGSDSARFIFNTHEANSGMDFDLDLAVAQDSKNPVYYVQYAYARICSIFKNIKDNHSIENANLDILTHENERKLISFIATYPSEIVKSAKNYDPTKITRYAITLANLFHKFYSSCKVVTESKELTNARLILCDSVRKVIKNILDMMKVDAPEFMN